MIHIICRTNLDGYENTRWPTCTACRPEKGDRITSKCRTKSLKIVGITHEEAPPDAVNSDPIPFLIIELNK
jgi:hypothetical protein